MAESTAVMSPPGPDRTTGSGELRLVLFGMPAAGKSSLLGALGQAAQTQEHLLGGKVVDLTGGLEELRHRLYDETARRTAEEVVPHPVRFEPFASPDQEAAEGAATPVSAVILDCDGRVANDLLLRRQELNADGPEGSLAREVLLADTLVLVVDAAAPTTQVEADFAEFDRFLRHMERGRARRSEVAGLPVFLVLTKCDLLAQPEDGPADWMDRIEQRKREVDARFREFLSRQTKDGQAPPFGRLDLHVWATAVKRPALAGSPAKPREPFGVAELFRQCLDEAAGFRQSVRRSGRRLVWTVGAVAVLVLGMLASGAGLLAVNRSNQVTRLAMRVEDFRALDRGGPADRLRGSTEDLRRKADTLRSIKADPSFRQLSKEQQDFVTGRLEEVEEYIPYLEKVKQLTRAPTPTSLRELEARQEKLRKELAPPREGWEGTEAVRLQKQLLDDLEALKKAVARMRNWYAEGYESASKLWTLADFQAEGGAGVDWTSWAAQAEKLLDPLKRPPFPDSDPIPDASGLLTWATVKRFAEVQKAASEYESEKERVKRLLELACALGLAPPSKERPAVLVVPRDSTLDALGLRLRELKSAYRDYAKRFALRGLPEAAVPSVRQAARAQYANLLRPGREAVRERYASSKGNEEARWEAVRSWLKGPAELASWRELADVLLHLDDPDAKDPVEVLAEFLRQPSFTFRLDKVTLEIPDRYRARPAPGKVFGIYWPPAGKQPAVKFEPTGEPSHDTRRKVLVYTYRQLQGKEITYKPGENLWAELALREEGKRLYWLETRTQRYRFERLRNPPRELREGAGSDSDGPLLEGVQLIFTPDDGVPRVPDLLPAVK